MSGAAFGYFLGFLLVVIMVWLLAGTLYYAVARRRLSFRQAITRPWVLGVGVLGLLLALLGQIASRI